MTWERPAGAVALALALVLALTGLPGATAQESPEERLVVDVEADGDAAVTTVYVYDLTDDGDRTSFAALEDERGNLSRTYAQRLRAVADGVANETGREMAIEDASASIDHRGDVGVVRLSVTWTNLAAIEGGRLVLAAPFDAAYDPDRPLVVRAPGGEEITNTAVEPSERSDGQASWSTERDLAGFQATMTGADDGGDDALAPSLAVPVLGLLAGGALAVARRRISR